jgi:hypothetical protein
MWGRIPRRNRPLVRSAEVASLRKTSRQGIYRNDVALTIFLSGRVIHLAHEVRSNDCLYDAAREHAWLHAHADERALAEKASTLSDALRRALAETLLGSGTSGLAAKSQMLATIAAQMDRQLDSVDQLRNQLNRSIDTPSALARLHAACDTQSSEPL